MFIRKKSHDKKLIKKLILIFIFISLHAFSKNFQANNDELFIQYIQLNDKEKLRDLIVNNNINKDVLNRELLNVYDINILKILIENGANVNYICGEYTIFDNLIQSIVTENNSDGYYISLKYLLNHGLNPNLKNEKGETPLFKIYLANYFDLAKEPLELLLKYGANIDFKNNEGLTPLSNEVSNNTLDLVQLFLEKGANPYVLNNKGEDVFDLVKSEKMKKLLKKYTADYGELFEIINSCQNNKNIELTLAKLEKSNIRTLTKFNKPKYFTDTQYISILNDYAFFLSETDRYKEAIPILERVILLSPNRAIAYGNLSSCYKKLYKETGDKNYKIEQKKHLKKYIRLWINLYLKI